MKTAGRINWLKIDYTAKSLYDVIKDGVFINLNIVPRESWKKLIDNTPLQLHCNRRGFNNVFGFWKIRIGIMSNNEAHCNTPDSFLGFGTDLTSAGDRNTKAFGYILVK